MPDDAPKSNALPQVPWTTLAPILTILTSLILATWQSLDSPRPPAAGEVEKKIPGGQNISARLWQDPISVTMKEIGDGAKAQPKELERDLTKPAEFKTGDRILLMPVIMLGGSYGQDVEFRSRTRFAVMTGLWSRGYAPVDSNRIGAFHFGAGEQATSRVATIGFEWCELIKPKEETLSKHLLVLWINEEDVYGDHLGWLQSLLKNCRAALRKFSPADDPAAKVLIAGSSSTLKGIAEEALEPGAVEKYKDLRAGIFACTTTADAHALLSDVKPIKEKENGGVEAVRPAKWSDIPEALRPLRTLPDDGQMMKSLVAELQARRVLPYAGDEMSRDARVVLISEYDTVYGRSLPLAFARAATELSEKTLQTVQSLVAAKKLPWLDIHNYARGFDGRLQGDAGAKPSSSDKESGKSKDSATTSVPPGEATEGLNQSDYLRRLALVIEKEDQALRSKNPAAGGVRAVGILGSDVYDKLMVLKALRTRLPETIFFTTDLDARLAQPKDWKVTHNLVIAAPFGLSPDLDHAQRGELGVAPFRDSYQTSVFKGVRQALGSRVEVWAPESMPVRMFEVGRNGAVPLVTTGSARNGTALSFLLARSWRGGIWVLFLTVIAIICGIIFNGRSATPPCARWRQAWKFVWHSSWIWFAFSCLVSTFITLCLAGQAGRYDDAEPLAFAEGVSIWPTVGFRILGVLMGFHYLAKARRSLAANGRQIAWKFFRLKFSLAAPATETQPSWTQRFAAWMKHNASLIFAPDSVVGTLAKNPHSRGFSPRDLWERYWKLTNRRVRRGRIGLMAVLYLIGSVSLFLWLGRPVSPVRGIFADNAERCSLMLWVIVQVVLTFAVLDSLMQMTALIRNLNQGRSDWPRLTLRKESDPTLEYVSWCEVLDIRLIGERTIKVGDLFLYPFLIQAAGIIGRIPSIDNWSWPLSLVIVIGLNVFFVIVSMVVLRFEAERARQQSLVRLRSRLVRQRRRGKDDKDEDRRRKAIESAIAFVRDTTEGAFAPATQQPAIRWVLWLISGFGAGGIMQYAKDLW